MPAKREQRPPRKMKQVFLVFCEGETEENYLGFLKRTYRSPIKIISKVEGDSISQKLIDRRKKELKISSNETITAFLMYDLDKTDVIGRLNNCNAEKLYSNPCIELWYLLHTKEQTTALSTQACCKALQNIGGVWSNYQKPDLTITQQNFLLDNAKTAIIRAKKLGCYENPSSTIFKLLEAIKN